MSVMNPWLHSQKNEFLVGPQILAQQVYRPGSLGGLFSMISVEPSLQDRSGTEEQLWETSAY